MKDMSHESIVLEYPERVQLKFKKKLFVSVCFEFKNKILRFL